jgi:nucleotide-binding universal stress UspA family protein
MFTQILVPTDGSPLAANAIGPAIALAKAMSARLTGVTVSTPYRVITANSVSISDTEEQYARDCNRRAERDLAPIKEAAQAAGIPFSAVHEFNDRVYESIIAVAARTGCDLIVMASHGRKGASAVLLGSKTTKVLTHSKIPVLVVR